MTVSSAPRSILIADDTPDIRMLLRLAVDRDGSFEVVGEAADGQQAVDLAGLLQPTAVLLDLAMPVMDGLQALPLLRKAAPESCIVVLSGFNAAQLAAETIALGASGYIEKGSLPEEILGKLKQLCCSEVPAQAAVERPEPPEMIASADALRSSGRRSEHPEFVDEMLAVLSHELAAPLTVVRGFADALEQGWATMGPEMTQNCVAGIGRNSRHMMTLIANFRDARKLDLNALDLERRDTDVTELVRETALDVAPGADALARVQLTMPSALPAFIDPSRVRQIISNLLGNAFKFGGADTAIELSVRADGENVYISVADNGPGIPRGREPELFEKFSRLEVSTKGTGLGLYLSRGIARAHGGDITVEPSVGHGACFTVRLPRVASMSSAVARIET